MQGERLRRWTQRCKRRPTVNHTAQGSCPGVGIIRLTAGGQSGYLAGVLRTTNTVSTAGIPAAPGGVAYQGAERSDVHGASVIMKQPAVTCTARR